MADHLTRERRSALLSRVRTKHTAGEILVRRMNHGLGFRFLLHRADLPGRPDIVLPRLKTVVFLNKCLWHGHSCDEESYRSRTSRSGEPKVAANKKRDRQAVRKLSALDWQGIVVWECATRKVDTLTIRLAKRLDDIKKTMRLNQGSNPDGKKIGSQ